MTNRLETIELIDYQEQFEQKDKYKLAKQLKYVTENSPFYYEKFKKAGFDSAPSIDAFGDLPFTTKSEILNEQMANPPYGRLATGNDPSSLRRVHVTSGSTGKPLFIILSEKDVAETIEAGGRAFRCAGLTPDDTVIHCLNYCLWAGGITDHLNLEATGAAVIPFGVGNTVNLIRTIRDLRPTSISCTPSYLSRLEYVLEKEFNMKPAHLGLKKAFLGGEGGVQDVKVRSKIETSWNMRAIDANYGMADVLSIFGAECDAREGLHFHGQGILHFELIDADKKTKHPLEDGQTGEMVLTHLNREAQPLVRYRTGDIVRIVSTKKCKCGRSSFKFLVIGRADDMIVVRGINVFPSAVGNLLNARDDWFSGEYQIVLDTPPPYERPLLRIELSSEYLMPDTDMLKKYIIDKCHSELNFTPRLEFLSFGEFPRSEGKTRRVIKI